MDGLARVRRRREPVGRWALWALACALPFLVVRAVRLRCWARSALVAAPRGPVPAERAAARRRRAASAVLACALVLGLAWLAWPALVRRLGLTRPRPDADARRAGDAARAARPSPSLVLGRSTRIAALLLVPALHLWLLIASPGAAPAPASAALALVALALAAARAARRLLRPQLGLGPGGVAWTAVLLLAGGHVGLRAALLWSLALGCLVAAALLALTPPATPRRSGRRARRELTIAGRSSYAGPGSLGGTESALRR